MCIVDSGCVIIDGEYLFHWVVVNECGGVRYVACWVHVRYSMRVKYRLMSVRYR